MTDSSKQVPTAGAPASGGLEYIQAVEAAGLATQQEPVTRLRYGAAPGQELDVYLPPGERATGDPLPVLIFFHGGAWIRGGLHWLRFMAPAVTALPAILVAGAYRLAPDSKWPAQYEDVRDAIRLVANRIHQFGGDPARMVAGGHSAGGHLASLAVLKREIPELRGCVPVSSPCDLRYGDVPLESEEGRVYKYLLEDRSQDAEASPVLFVKGNRVPFHVIWGSRDFKRIIQSSTAFTAALQAAGTRVTQQVVEDAGHFDTHLMLSDPANRWYAQVRELLAPTPVCA